MEDLAKLTAAVTEFAARAALTIVPAVPEQGYGPEVCLGPDALDLAEKLGGGMLYLRAVPFSPGGDDDQPGDPPSHLIRHKGKTGQVSVAFAANGLVHFWEHHTAWYLEWQELTDSDPSRRGPGMDEPDQLSEGERARLASDAAAPVLADPEFRASPRGDRQRLARNAIPRAPIAGSSGKQSARHASGHTKWPGRSTTKITPGRLGELAAEFLASPAYQQASSPLARKKAAERFLLLQADRFSPPTDIRDELYARARQLARTAKGSGLF